MSPKTDRTCTECGASLAGRSTRAKTCSSECRQARSRRIRGIRVENGKKRKYDEAQEAVANIVKGETEDMVREAMAEQIKPIVREELAGRVLEQIDRLITLTPEALDALYEDLRGDDAVLRQRAYTLLLKYTVGSPLATDAETEDEKTLVVNVGMPATGGDTIDAEVVTTKTCDVCLEEKPEDQFEGNSERCVKCFTEARERAAHLLDGD